VSLPIKATPVLRGKDAVRFLEAIHRKNWGTKPLIPTPKFKKLINELRKRGANP